MAQTTQTMWTNRIVAHGEESPDQLLANPANWRVHPDRQQQTVNELLSRVGWVQEVLVNRRTGHVVNGHLRVMLASRRDEPKVPVAYIDVSLDEERVLLASLDTVAEAAVADQEQLASLLTDIERGNPVLDDLYARLLTEGGAGGRATGSALIGRAGVEPILELRVRFETQQQLEDALKVIAPETMKASKRAVTIAAAALQRVLARVPQEQEQEQTA